MLHCDFVICSYSILSALTQDTVQVRLRESEITQAYIGINWDQQVSSSYREILVMEVRVKDSQMYSNNAWLYIYTKAKHKLIKSEIQIKR